LSFFPQTVLLPAESSCDGVPFSSNLGTGAAQCSPLDVSGTRRFKYFTSPSLKDEYYPQIPHNEVVTSAKEDLLTTQKEIKDHLDELDSVEYSNNGTQTDALSNQIIIAGESQCQRNDELSLVQLERQQWEHDRQILENMLPPVTDEKTLKQYRTFLKESEKKTFALKEKELDSVINTKMKNFKKSIFDKYARNDLLIERRIEVRCIFCALVLSTQRNRQQ